MTEIQPTQTVNSGVRTTTMTLDNCQNHSPAEGKTDSSKSLDSSAAQANAIPVATNEDSAAGTHVLTPKDSYAASNHQGQNSSQIKGAAACGELGVETFVRAVENSVENSMENSSDNTEKLEKNISAETASLEKPLEPKDTCNSNETALKQSPDLADISISVENSADASVTHSKEQQPFTEATSCKMLSVSADQSSELLISPNSDSGKSETNSVSTLASRRPSKESYSTDTASETIAMETELARGGEPLENPFGRSLSGLEAVVYTSPGQSETGQAFQLRWASRSGGPGSDTKPTKEIPRDLKAVKVKMEANKYKTVVGSYVSEIILIFRFISF